MEPSAGSKAEAQTLSAGVRQAQGPNNPGTASALRISIGSTDIDRLRYWLHVRLRRCKVERSQVNLEHLVVVVTLARTWSPASFIPLSQAAEYSPSFWLTIFLLTS